MMPECEITATRGYLEAGGTRLSYLEWPGEGPPVLLLHGITSSAATLWRIAPALAATGRRVVALDMPGHGLSDVSPAHDIDTIAGLAAAVLTGLGLRGATLVGHSWGGATALALAGGDHPARANLDQLILIDPLLGMTRSWGARVMPNYTSGLGQPAAAMAPIIAASNPDWHPCDVHWKAEALEHCRYAQVEGLFVHSGDWDLIERLPQVAVPLLFLVADPKHTIIPHDILEDVGRRLPAGARIEVVPGTTHNMLRGPGYTPTMEIIQDWLG